MITVKHEITVALFDHTMVFNPEGFEAFKNACKEFLIQEGMLPDHHEAEDPEERYAAWAKAEMAEEATSQTAPGRVMTGRSEDGEPQRFRIQRPADLAKYVWMHEEGAGKDRIVDQMLMDGVGDIEEAWCMVLRQSGRVERIKPPVDETPDECIERLKAQNAKEAEERQRPKVAKSNKSANEEKIDKRKRDLSAYEAMLNNGASDKEVRAQMKADGISDRMIPVHLKRAKEVAGE